MAPEAQIIILNAVILGVAYLGIYPTTRNLTANKMAIIDCVLTTISLCVAGALFWGSGTVFSLFGIGVNWAVFAFASFVAMEIPLVIWFIQRNDIKFFDDRDDDFD